MKSICFPTPLSNVAASLLTLVILGMASSVAGATGRAENVFVITTDGLRWQEVFRGAEEILISKEVGRVRDTNALRRDFWRPTPEERRRALMPFFWSEIATNGQLFGNQDRGSAARVTNGKNFSYPGYNELLAGFPDARVDSNDKIPNANVTVFEWLHNKPGFNGRVAAFGCWDVFPSIFNRDRARFPIHAGWEIVDAPNPSREAIHRVLRQTPREWDGVIYDAFMFDAALAHIREHQPRAAYLAFGETDDWAHDGRYDHYLNAAHRFDAFVKQLWEMLQSMPNYRAKTTFLISTDHGRGTGPVAWKSHSQSIPESAFIWIAALGPDIAPLGERANVPEVHLGQLAATAAAALGEDFRKDIPRALPPVADLLPKAGRRP
jgi:hypothetical protein